MKTTYTKTVAVIRLQGTTYFAHESMAAADGRPYLTTDIADAKDFTYGGAAPKGYRLRKITRTVDRECLGGGYILECGPTGP